MNFQDLFSFFQEAFERLMGMFLDFDKRINWLYLLSSFGLAYFVYIRSKRTQSFIKYFFKKENWWSKTAGVDYFFIFLNAGLKSILFIGFLRWGMEIQNSVNEYLLVHIGIPTQDYSIATLAVFYSLALLVFGELTYYLVHLAYHKIPFLWEFHKIHHSSTALNPFTQYRIHPVELWLNNLRYILVLSLLNGVFDYYSEGYYGPSLFYGINIMVLVFNFWGANLRHSHIRLTYFNWLESFLISPFQHQIHHSNNPELYNKNMGSKLAIWDWLFGTLVKSKEVDDLQVGLGEDDTNYDSFSKNLFRPFYRAFWGMWKDKLKP